MKRVIREMSKFSRKEAEAILDAYQSNELETTTFPFKGDLVDGVIWREEQALYLIPIKSVNAMKFELPEDFVERVPEDEMKEKSEEQ